MSTLVGKTPEPRPRDELRGSPYIYSPCSAEFWARIAELEKELKIVEEAPENAEKQIQHSQG